ncbi:hypothetical protein [Jiangella mangrovi]|uniref:Uncharacterized protein n=1 Tax=Jiangella mangrovi TaxID=1524084 RepID=A0A7W9GRU4_9ACTN|nr:hypothetical protein [Jiangella mangrovi]MBB5788571.1 hypothetical protein [Jiangella mangrovi]
MEPTDTTTTGRSRRGLIAAAGAAAAVTVVGTATPARAEAQVIDSGPDEIGLRVNADGQGGSFYQKPGATADTHALSCVCKATTGRNSALNVTSDNPAFSAMQVSGRELDTGTIKIAHVGQSDGSDGDAAAVSISLGTAGTAAQGIFIDAPNGTSGTYLQLKAGTQRMLRIHGDGRIQFHGPATVAPSSALPATPSGWFRFLTPGGQVVRVPYYAE